MLAFLLLAAVITGPSSSAPPFVSPTKPNALTISLLTSGDSVNAKPDGTPYRMVGAPDGLGAYDNGDGTFTLLMNHEIAATAGIPRAHGTRGAFVSKWTIRKNDLRVLRGEDLIRQVVLWNRDLSFYEPPRQGVPMTRFCSATFMPAYEMFLSGEETFEGRVFAHFLDGTSYQLPRLGRAQWENAVMHPSSSKTIVVNLDDIDGGFVYVYTGQKQSGGNAIERAGLTNGTLSVIAIPGVPGEHPLNGIPSGSTFRLLNLGDVSSLSGGSLRTLSNVLGATRWQRPEDGAWDPNHPLDFYFATTASPAGRSRLWRLRFHSLDDPAAGGTLDMLLDGTEGPKMMDNIAVRASGDVIIQEDPGPAIVARIWRYVPSTDSLEVIAHRDAALAGAESSGVIDVSHILGPGWMLFDVQAHAPADVETVDRGQLLAMRLPVTRRHSAAH